MLKQSHHDFADRLRRARLRAGYKGPAEAADAHRWNKNTYKSRENAVRGIPDQEDVRDYANAFKVPFMWLLAGEGPPPDWDQKPTALPAVVVAPSAKDNSARLHSGSIQVALDDLQIVFRDIARLGGIEEAQAEALADVAIAKLQALPIADVVHRLERLSRTDPESAGRALVDP